MAEQDQTETKSGIGFSGVVGGVGAGVGANLLADTAVSRSGIANALARNDKASEKFSAKTASILADNANRPLRSTHHAIETLKTIENADNVKSVHFIANEGGKGFTAHIKVAGLGQGLGDKTVTLHNVVKAPEGFTDGIVTDVAKLKGFIEGEKAPLKSSLAQSEKELVTGIHKAGGRVMGISNAGWKGKGAIAVGTVASIVVGAKVVHAIFGGKHSSQVAANDTDRTQETAAAR